MTLTPNNHHDTFNFNHSMVIRWGLITRLSLKWEKWTRWFRPRFVVTNIDHEEGNITIKMEHWSWLKWKWIGK